MRSGDGDTAILQRLCALVVLLALFEVLPAREYLISYEYITKDAMPCCEKLQVARAMQPCKGKRIHHSLYLAYPKKQQPLRVDALLKREFERFFDYIASIGLEVRHMEHTTDMQNSSYTRLRLPTTCFKVDFNDSFVTITAIKKR